MFSAATPQLSFARSQDVLGTIKFWNKEKGFGFVKQEGSNAITEYFAHITKVVSGTREREEGFLVGDKVIFTPTNNDKGLTAEDIKLVDD